MAFTDASRRMASEDDDDILAKTSKNETKIESKTLIKSRGPNTTPPIPAIRFARIRDTFVALYIRHTHDITTLWRVCSIECARLELLAC